MLCCRKREDMKEDKRMSDYIGIKGESMID